MNRFLVTGAQGFVGRYLVAELLETDPDAQVVGIGRSPERPGAFSDGRPLPPSLARTLATRGARYRYAQIPLNEVGALKAALRDLEPECVFHLASALHSAPEGDLLRTNIDGTMNLLNALEGHSTLLVHGSSSSVYGPPRCVPISEQHPCAPVDVYGVSKWTAERLVAVKAGRLGIRWVAARIFNVVGPGQTSAHVCGRFAERLVAVERGAEPVLEVGPLEPTRDFVDVRDVARGLLLLARRGAAGERYNLGSGVETSIREVLRELVRASGLDVRVREGGSRSPGVSRQRADISKLLRLGHEPRYALSRSLRDVLEDHGWRMARRAVHYAARQSPRR